MTIKPETVAKQIEQQRDIVLSRATARISILERTSSTIKLQLAPAPRQGWSPKEKEILHFMQDYFWQYNGISPAIQTIASHFDRSEGGLRSVLYNMTRKAGLSSLCQLYFVQID